MVKIQPEHLAHLRQALAKHDTEFHRSRYKAAGLSDMRYRWDLARHAGLITYFCDVLYAYMNDNHIDTALRRLVKPL